MYEGAFVVTYFHGDFDAMMEKVWQRLKIYTNILHGPSMLHRSKIDFGVELGGVCRMTLFLKSELIGDIVQMGMYVGCLPEVRSFRQVSYRRIIISRGK
jgi:hypothetical protein